MVSDLTWIIMLVVGMIAIVVAMFMLSAYLQATKKHKQQKEKKQVLNAKR